MLMNNDSSQNPNNLNSPAPGSPENNYGPIEPPSPPKKKKWYKKKAAWLITVLVLCLLSGGGLYAYYLSTQKDVATSNDSSAQPKTEPQKELVPNNLLYVTTKYTDGDTCSMNEETVHGVSLADNESKKVTTIEDYQSVVQYSTHEDKIVIATDSSCASSEGPALLYSSDGGASFEKIFEGESLGDVVADQITGVTFSSDGNSIVFGYLPNDSRKNTAKLIDVKTRDVNDLFTIDDAGLFPVAYDGNKLHYSSGCYNCGGGKIGIKTYDMTDDKHVALFSADTAIGYDISLNPKQNKALQLINIGNNNYQIVEFEVATKKQATIVEISGVSGGNPRAGYSDRGVVYYTKDSSFYLFNDGESVKMFDAPDPISNVYYVGDGKIIYSTGTQEGGTVYIYDIDNTQESSKVYDYEYPGRILGITAKFETVE